MSHLVKHDSNCNGRGHLMTAMVLGPFFGPWLVANAVVDAARRVQWPRVSFGGGCDCCREDDAYAAKQMESAGSQPTLTYKSLVGLTAGVNDFMSKLEDR